MAKTKILLLLHTLSLSGAPKIALDAIEQMPGQVEVRTLSLEGGPLAERCRELGQLDLLHNPKHNLIQRRWQRTFGRRLLETDLRRWKPDVIYANSIVSLEIVRTMRLPSVPSLLHVHELETAFDYFSELCNAFLKTWPQHYIAVSNPVRELLISRYQIEPRRISIVHEFVRNQDFDAQIEASVEKDSRFTVGGAGTPNWRKGISLWLQTADELRKLVGADKFRFVWVGMKNDFDSMDFRNETRLRGLENTIEFIPATEEPFRYFAKFDVFAMTSWEDPCPVVVLENMMLQKPVLCFAGSGGAPEEVGNSGIVIDCFCPATMARAIASLMIDLDQVKQRGAQARSRVEQRFTASHQVPKILEIIQNLSGQ